MARKLIDAEAFWKKLTSKCEEDWCDLMVVYELLEDFPAAEPEVRCVATIHADKEMVAKWINEALQNGIVHCKDCKHYIYDGDRWLCKVLSNNYEPIVDLEVDGYCSYGERRADDEEIH